MKNGNVENPLERHTQQRDAEKARKKFVVFENALRIIDKLTAEESGTLYPAAQYLAEKLPRGPLSITNHDYYVKKNDSETQDDQLFRLDDKDKVLLFGGQDDLEFVHDVGLASEKDYHDLVADVQEEFEKLKMTSPYSSTREALS